MNEFSLRAAAREEAPALAEILVAACRARYRAFAPPPVLDSLDAAAFAREMAASWDAYQTLVSVDPGEARLGFVRFGPDHSGDTDGATLRGHVRSLYVSPEAAGRGVGGALLGAALERLDAEGLETVTLWVFEGNREGRRFYERHGFTSTGTTRVEPGWGLPVVRYVHPTAPGAAAAGEVLVVTSPTEDRNPRTADIDQLGVRPLLERINDEDALVAGAVRRALPAVAELVEAALRSVDRGGRVQYFGAGTSGRIALLDAVELPPTFGVSPDLFVAHLAGGDRAVRRAREGSEDDEAQGAREAAASVTGADLVIGIAASGYTRYVGGALRAARDAGAHTGLVTSNPAAPLASLADTLVVTGTGAEVITGSTRMKAATAQKLVLNSFSTAVMVRTGRTWSNLMVDVVPTNAKLRGRVVRLLAQATGLEEGACEEALVAAGNETKTALVMLLSGRSARDARAALSRGAGVVARALTQVDRR